MLKVLAAHATAIAKEPSLIATMRDQKTELGILDVLFVKFTAALEDGGYQQDFLSDSMARETITYWRFWDQHGKYKRYLSNKKPKIAKSDGRGRTKEE